MKGLKPVDELSNKGHACQLSSGDLRLLKRAVEENDAVM